MVQDQARVWYPDGRAVIVPLRGEPKHGSELVALGVRERAWIVADVRVSGNPDVAFDIWVRAAGERR